MSGHVLICDAGPPAIVHRRGASPLLLLCDHAGRAVPSPLGDLGLPAAAWDRHIAWDIGAEALALALAERWDATLIAQRYSRLVIDCNRDPARADAVPEVSDGQAIPANAALSREALAARVAAIHAPYHAVIEAEVDARLAAGTPTQVVAVHSFTPRMAGLDRPWRFGVLHLGGSRFSDATLAALREAGEAVGDNEPYRMDAIDYTVPRHAIARGLDYLELEVRQELIASVDGVAAVAAVLGDLIPRGAAQARGEG